MLEKGNLTCMFSIAAKRGITPISFEEQELLEPAQLRYLLRYKDAIGCAYIELLDEDEQASVYYHNFYLPTSLSKILTLASVFTTSTLTALGLITLSPALSAGVIPCVALSLGMRGTVVKYDGPIMSYEDRIDHPISRKKYQEIKDYLDNKAGKTTFYHLLFNNCAHLAATAASMAGLPQLKTPLINCPDLMARRIRKQAETENNLPGQAISLIQALRQGTHALNYHA